MSTRSQIFVTDWTNGGSNVPQSFGLADFQFHSDGGVYKHFDGYPENIVPLLVAATSRPSNGATNMLAQFVALTVPIDHPGDVYVDHEAHGDLNYWYFVHWYQGTRAEPHAGEWRLVIGSTYPEGNWSGTLDEAAAKWDTPTNQQGNHYV